MNESIYDVIRKNKEIPFIIAYFIFILASSIYLVLNYWNPISLQNFDYFKSNTTATYRDGTEYNKIIHKNQTMKVELITTNQTVPINQTMKVEPITTNQTVPKGENDGSEVLFRYTINETGTTLQNNAKHNFKFDKNIDREFQLILLA